MAETPPNRILLVPVDDTEENERALEWALENIHKQGDLVQFLHVVHHSHFTSMVQQSEQQEEILVDQAHNWIQERFTHTCDQMGASYKVLVLKGTTDADSIGQNICHQAENAGVAVVVMAAHNKGRQIKFIVGSVTQYCTKHCSKTVLVMH
ncbi:hypothetical protein ABBQ38_015305 [Trebouxia sp. C0009 RCD-2024]